MQFRQLERIRRFQLDAGLIYPRGLDTSGTVVTPLYDEKLALVGVLGLLGDDPVPSWPTIAGLPLCLLQRGMRGRDLLDETVAAHDVQLDPRIETDSIAGLIALVRTGRWATIVPRTWVPETESEGLRCVLLAVAGAHVALVRADAEPASVLTAAFEREVRDARAVHS
ncbi:hypothetical protein C6V83_04200 [Gordonia iterans]|uniref:LysR substrate-binding domain-containing protein n=1 Tax=Gordonia iterans TaxID=1004901 RepID=A0A2S0KD23_9ACTN|nr:LysR family transcriptional regulator substrate-binding protein [Gordonia iterans]AVL99601.1 hypothetical protein C6V83_04200 [Gordonia iterans]